MKIRESIANKLEYIREIRRYLHTIPEESLKEFKTQKYLLEKICDLNADTVEVIANTGIKLVFYAKKPEFTIGFRADMDALPMSEANKSEYVSCHPGHMHACGHDGHMAILLTLGKYISEHRSQLKNNVVLVFQPGEEGTGGAKLMIDGGALENPHVDKMYGIHLDPSLCEGKVGTAIGYLMASTTEFDIEIQGVTAHGATPHLGVDALVAASDLIMQLQTIVSRQVDPLKKAVLTIGKVSAGESRNIIAGTAKLEGIYRAYSDEIVTSIGRGIVSRIEAIENIYGVKCKYLPFAYYPAVNNDETVTRDIMGVVDKEDLILLEPRMIAEDYSFYQKEIPAAFMFLGIKKDDFVHPLHSANFDFEEHSLLYGLEVYARLLGMED